MISIPFWRSPKMKRVVTIGVVFLLICPLAIGDQAVPLASSVCNNIQGALLSARWGPNVNNCQWPNNGGTVSYPRGAPFQCIGQACMNDCQGRCQDCNSKVCAATTITVDNSCSHVTSLLWITSYYSGGGGGGGH